MMREDKSCLLYTSFKDPISSRTDRSMAIHYGDGLWLDAQKDGNAWLNPYSACLLYTSRCV